MVIVRTNRVKPAQTGDNHHETNGHAESNGHTNGIAVNYKGAYEFHGVELRPASGGWLQGDCPFCGKERHFHVKAETGQWNCKVGGTPECAAGGNLYTFLQHRHLYLLKETSKKSLLMLAKIRGLPLEAFHGTEITSDNAGMWWYLPSYNKEGKVAGLDVYQGKGKPICLTPTTTHQLGGAHDLAFHRKKRKKPTVYICEGRWDAIALKWLMRQAKVPPAIICWVPGATIFKRAWIELFKGFDVNLIYDADATGINGIKKAASLLAPVAKSLKAVAWPEEVKQGYDLNDFVSSYRTGADYPHVWERLQGWLKPMEAQADPSLSTEILGRQGQGEPPTFRRVLREFQKSIYLSSGMETALAVCCATAISSRMPGDCHIWMFLVGPPGVGKSLLIQSFAGSPHTDSKSSITAKSLVSGYHDGTGEDYSLIPKWKNKCVLIKDWTTIMTHTVASLEAIFGILRDYYDGRVEFGFGNQRAKHFEGHSSFLVGVTPIIHGDTRSSLGERFLKCEFLEANHDFKAHIRAATEMADKAIPVGLKTICNDFIDRDIPEVLPKKPEWFIDRVISLAEIVAVFRAGVERDKGTNDLIMRPVPEVGTRLAKQLTRLGQALALVFGMEEINEKCWGIVKQVGFNTCIGWNQEVFTELAKVAPRGIRCKDLAHRLALSEKSLDRKLDNLVELRAVVRKRMDDDSLAYWADQNLVTLLRSLQ